MKKFVYFCAMMLLCSNIMAQIDLNDRNWEPVVQDSFNTPNRYFDSTFQDSEGKWISFVPCLKSGVTKPNTHQIYQWRQCVFDNVDGVLKLHAMHIQDTPVLCTNPPSYDLPPNLYGLPYHCDSDHQSLYYHSGIIESPPQDVSLKTNHLPPPRFRYGYFEIRCKLPIHEGAFPAFWLWDADNQTNPDDKYYEEIDIFEFSWSFEDSPNHHHNPHPHGAGNPYCFTSGLYYNDVSTVMDGTSRARVFPMIDDSLSHWHTFACEWLPDHITWYCDGNVVNEYHNPDSIPRHHLALKANYAIDRYALIGHVNEGSPAWKGSDNMVIDYINVYQLKWKCDEDKTIACQLDLDTLNFAVRKSISITAAQELVKVDVTDKVTFRATDHFTITGPFQVNSGGELTVIMQRCPETQDDDK